MSLKQIDMNFGPNYKDYGVIGYSEKISEVVTIVKTIAPTGLSVLVSGESGTGKEIFAELIHRLSDRKNRIFVPINCGAIPEGLIENELFGHEKGSFTSATDRSKGYFENADGGTIFLDEIGELPLQAQVKLLRVLENGTFMKVGGVKNIKVNVRIVAATNKDLVKMVEKGQFREDLYYRLKAVTINLPSLRERLADIPVFVLKFAFDSAAKYKRDVLTFEKDAISEIVNHHWKGNIRELKNFIDMLTVMETGKTVTGASVRKYLKSDVSGSYLPVLVKDNEDSEKNSEVVFRTLLEIKNEINLIKKFIFNTYSRNISPGYFDRPERTVEEPSEPEIVSGEPVTDKDEIVFTLKKHGGNRRKAASELKISERTLYRKIEKYGIEL